MKTIGLITEYNPFHNGHLHQLDLVRNAHSEEVAFVAVMSGPWTQRGEPSIVNRWTKTKQALSCGVNLVIEMPVAYSCAPAPIFANMAIKLLSSLGIVSTFACGSETTLEERQILHRIAEIFEDEPDELSQEIKKNLSNGWSYSASCAKALSEYYAMQGENKTSLIVQKLLKGSNNWLCIEYLKANRKLTKPLKPHIHAREGTTYLSPHLSQPEQPSDCTYHSSARAIRTYLQELMTQADALPDIRALALEQFRPLFAHMPDQALAPLLYALQTGQYLNLNTYAEACIRCLLADTPQHLATYFGWDIQLAKRTLNHLYFLDRSHKKGHCWEDLLNALDAKHLTSAQIQRALAQRYLGIQQTDHELFKDAQPLFIRVLGFDQTGRYLLKHLKTDTDIPIFMRASDELSTSAYSPALKRLIEIDHLAHWQWQWLAKTGNTALERQAPIQYKRPKTKKLVF